MATTIKLQDTSSKIGTRSRLEIYWFRNGFEKFYLRYRKGIKLPAQYQTMDSIEKMQRMYKLDAIGFGNWVTQEDRFNYMSALNIGLYDIDKVLKFKGNIGLHNTISFSFGARGQGGALAHFEPSTFIINVTRYIDADMDKEYRFVYTGGAGSVAHEYGHALDYYFGIFRESITNVASLSGGNSVATKWSIAPTPIRKAMTELLQAIIWNEPYKKLSNYYHRLEKNFGGDYMFRRNEIFARAFEKYIQYKLQKLGITNKFLNDTKYEPSAYLTTAELEKVLPLFDALIYKMRNAL